MPCECIACHKKVICAECTEDERLRSKIDLKLTDTCDHNKASHNVPSACPVLKYQRLKERQEYQKLKQQAQHTKQLVQEHRQKPEPIYLRIKKLRSDLADCGEIVTHGKHKKFSMMGFA